MGTFESMEASWLEPDDPGPECPTCEGTGTVVCSCDGRGCGRCIDGERTCEACDGSGYLPAEPPYDDDL